MLFKGGVLSCVLYQQGTSCRVCFLIVRATENIQFSPTPQGALFLGVNLFPTTKCTPETSTSTSIAEGNGGFFFWVFFVSLLPIYPKNDIFEIWNPYVRKLQKRGGKPFPSQFHRSNFIQNCTKNEISIDFHGLVYNARF